MRIRFLTHLLPLALGLSLSACDRSETAAPTAPEVSPETLLAAPRDAVFAREAQAIKSREKDPARIEAAMRALTSRYGYPARPEEGPVPAEAASQALGKGAGTSSWTMVRAVNVIYHFAHFMTVSVPANLLLEVVANQVDGGSDPMVLGFYRTTGSGNASAYWVKFVGYNDDRVAGNLNSRFTWKNTTGATKTVRLVSWSYPGTSGKTTLAYRLLNNGMTVALESKTKWVSGWMEFDTSVPSDYDNCTGPTLSKVELQRNPTHAPSNYGHSLIAFNGETMGGAYIRDTDYALGLNEVLPSNGTFPHFLLGYFEGDGYQPDPMGTSDAMKKLDAHYGYPFYFARQIDRYTCP